VWFRRISHLKDWRGCRSSDTKRKTALCNDVRLRDGEDGLSLYRVQGYTDARRVAALYRMVNRPDPGRLDYLVIPDDLLNEFQVLPCPYAEMPSVLRDIHHEIKGWTVDDAAHLVEKLISHAAAATDDAKPWDKLTEADLLTIVPGLLRDHPELLDFLDGRWIELIRGT